MPFSNTTALVMLSMMFGAAVSINFIGAESYLLSVTQPIYAVYSSIAAGLCLWLLVKYLALRRMKFAVFAVCGATLYVAALLVLTGSFLGDSVHAVGWFFLAIFGHRFFRWIVSNLVLRHLDPARAQTHLSYLVSTYETGMLVSLVFLKLGRIGLDPRQAVQSAAWIFAGGIGFVILVFCPKRNFEIIFSHHAEAPPVIEESKMKAVLLPFVAICLLFGTFKITEEYLIRVVLKETLVSYAAIRNMVTSYRLVGNAIIVVAGLAAARLIRRRALSPLALLVFQFSALLALTFVALVTRWFGAFVALETGRWVMENGIFFIATQLLGSSFFGEYRRRLSTLQSLFFYSLAGIPLLALFSALLPAGAATQKTVLLALVGFVLACALALVVKLRGPLARCMEAFLKTGHKTAGIYAVNLLSLLQPPWFEEEMARALATAPKKLLRKTIIVALGFVDDEKAMDDVIKEFHSDQEEIQFAVLDALRVSRRYRAGQFLAKVVRADVRPKTVRVRINAAKALAAMYGRQSIPFLLGGLDDPDARIVANTLETLAEFKDAQLVPYFLKFAESSQARVRANALMGLAGVRRTRARYREGVAAGLRSTDPNLVASTVYVVGVLKDQAFVNELERIAATDLARDPAVKRCLTFALILVKPEAGLPLFDEVLAASEETLDSFMHFFSQFDRETRMDLVRHAALSKKAPLKNLESALHRRTFDFHEELDFLYVLKETVSRESS